MDLEQIAWCLFGLCFIVGIITIVVIEDLRQKKENKGNG